MAPRSRLDAPRQPARSVPPTPPRHCLLPSSHHQIHAPHSTRRGTPPHPRDSRARTPRRMETSEKSNSGSARLGAANLRNRNKIGNWPAGRQEEGNLAVLFRVIDARRGPTAQFANSKMVSRCPPCRWERRGGAPSIAQSIRQSANQEARRQAGLGRSSGLCSQRTVTALRRRAPLDCWLDIPLSCNGVHSSLECWLERGKYCQSGVWKWLSHGEGDDFLECLRLERFSGRSCHTSSTAIIQVVYPHWEMHWSPRGAQARKSGFPEKRFPRRNACNWPAISLRPRASATRDENNNNTVQTTRQQQTTLWAVIRDRDNDA